MAASGLAVKVVFLVAKALISIVIEELHEHVLTEGRRSRGRSLLQDSFIGGLE
jgi:hypothetical protein